MNKGLLIVLSLVLSVSTIVEAGSKRKNSENVISGNSSSLDMNAMPLLTEHERSLAKQWMLKETDWVKYKQLMSGPRGIWSPGLDPITALGVSETDQKERKRYAELWIKVESRRAELELAFEVERQLAAKKILGDKLLVKNTQWIGIRTEQKLNHKCFSLQTLIVKKSVRKNFLRCMPLPADQQG
jgi:integrating conjugative element protein (TIGR03759 family)